MVDIRPFAAIRPEPHNASKVASVPYDVVDTREAAKLAKGNPASFLHVVRPEIDLSTGIGLYDDAVYAKARANFDRFLADGTLTQEAETCLYLYRLVMQHTTQVGLVCCCRAEDYATNIIKKHENTRREKEDDRTRHVLTLNANAGPVFLTYRDVPEIDTDVTEEMNRRPLFHFDAADGVTHTGWIVQDTARFIELFARVPSIYVADGHHRSASAARAGIERRNANPDHTGDEEYNWFLTVLFPASQLSILAYNRVVSDLNGLSARDVLARMADVGTVSATEKAQPDRRGVFCVYLDGRWHRLEIDPTTIDASDPIASLDVSLLQDRILQPILGIGDPRTDPRLGFVGGIRGCAELERRVDSGKADLAVSLFPTSIEQLLTVADADEVLPPKSTWFEPKLRSGLFVHSLE